MKSNELAANAKAFASVTTCYLKGWWGQYMSRSEYNRILAMYPDNKKYNNEKYVGTDCHAFDCICFVKSLLAGGTVSKRLSYGQMASNPLGDCTTETFAEKLYDCLPKQDLARMDVPAGYGLSKPGHAALSLGDGIWIDASFNYGGQNGVLIHYGGVPATYKCGKIPGVDYSDQPVPVPDDAAAFRDYLIKHAGEIIDKAFNDWKEGK